MSLSRTDSWRCNHSCWSIQYWKTLQGIGGREIYARCHGDMTKLDLFIDHPFCPTHKKVRTSPIDIRCRGFSRIVMPIRRENVFQHDTLLASLAPWEISSIQGILFLLRKKMKKKPLFSIPLVDTLVTAHWIFRSSLCSVPPKFLGGIWSESDSSALRYKRESGSGGGRA